MLCPRTLYMHTQACPKPWRHAMPKGWENPLEQPRDRAAPTCKWGGKLPWQWLAVPALGVPRPPLHSDRHLPAVTPQGPAAARRACSATSRRQVDAQGLCGPGRDPRHTAPQPGGGLRAQGSLRAEFDMYLGGLAPNPPGGWLGALKSLTLGGQGSRCRLAARVQPPCPGGGQSSDELRISVAGVGSSKHILGAWAAESGVETQSWCQHLCDC